MSASINIMEDHEKIEEARAKLLSLASEPMTFGINGLNRTGVLLAEFPDSKIRKILSMSSHGQEVSAAAIHVLMDIDLDDTNLMCLVEGMRRSLPRVSSGRGRKLATLEMAERILERWQVKHGRDWDDDFNTAADILSTGDALAKNSLQYQRMLGTFAAMVLASVYGPGLVSRTYNEVMENMRDNNSFSLNYPPLTADSFLKILKFRHEHGVGVALPLVLAMLDIE